MFIENYLDIQEEEMKAIDVALEEAEKGYFVSQKAMHKWFDSWGTENELPSPEPDIFPEN